MHQQATIIFPSETRVIVKEESFTVDHNKGFENNENLQRERKHFHDQAMWLYKQLMAGRKITGFIAWQEYKIQDLRARKYAIKKKGGLVTSEPILGGHGALELSMTEEQKKYNKNKFGF